MPTVSNMDQVSTAALTDITDYLRRHDLAVEGKAFDSWQYSQEQFNDVAEIVKARA